MFMFLNFVYIISICMPLAWKVKKAYSIWFVHALYVCLYK